MTGMSCRQCGEALPEGANRCPHCGALQSKRVPAALIAAFFIIGVLLGLLFVDSHYYAQLYRSLVVPEQSEQTAARQGGKRAPAAAGGHEATPAAEPGTAPQGGESMLDCDPEMAQRIRAKALEIAELQEAPGVLHVRLRKQWEYYTPGIRRSFLQAFAESDVCLEGRARLINFYYQGELIAVSRPPSGLHDEPPEVPLRD